MSNKKTFLFPLRLLVYIPYFAKKSYSTHKRHYQIMREFYNKKAHQLLTLLEIAEYLGVPEQHIMDNLPEFERK